MNSDSVKTYYSAKELSLLSLTCLPNSVQGIIYQAKKNHWATQKKLGRGGGVEYALASLPIQVQNEIRDRYIASLIQCTPKAASVKSHELHELNAKQSDLPSN